jgi:hypothetical protein
MSVMHKLAIAPVSPLMGLAEAFGGKKKPEAVVKRMIDKRKKRQAAAKVAGSQGPNYR